MQQLKKEIEKKIEDYQRRLQQATNMLLGYELVNSENRETVTRLQTKASCYRTIISELEKVIADTTGNEKIDTYSVFNNITDLRPYLLRHPNGEMVESSCLHYLGDDAQMWWHNRKVAATGITKELPKGRTCGHCGTYWISNERCPECFAT